MSITLRQAQFDFSTASPRWAPEWEFAYSFNAQSILFPPLERFLNRVMATARAKIDGDTAADASLRDDISKFIQQEGQHYAIHTQFNTMLEQDGFDRLPEFEKRMDEEYRELLKTKSLKFLCAYCDGFETLGPIFARIYLDGLEEYFVEAHPEVVAMWKWHLLEEYEHRTVCYDVYERLFGGYFGRIQGLLAGYKHMGGFIKEVQDYMLERERSKMTEAEVAASRKRLKRFQKKMGRMSLLHIIRVFLPFYTPRRAREPASFKSYARELEARFG